MAEFATNFRHLRNKIGLTKTELALVLEVPEKRINDWEYNVHTPKNIHIRKHLSDFFLVTEDELFNKKLN